MTKLFQSPKDVMFLSGAQVRLQGCLHSQHHQVLSLLDGKKKKEHELDSLINKKHEMISMILDTLFGLVCWTSIIIVSLDLYV
jgi:hypothetical protein